MDVTRHKNKKGSSTSRSLYYFQQTREVPAHKDLACGRHWISKMKGSRTFSAGSLLAAVVQAGLSEITEGRRSLWLPPAPCTGPEIAPRPSFFGLSRSISSWPRGGAEEESPVEEEEAVLYLPELLDAAVSVSEQVSWTGRVVCITFLTAMIVSQVGDSISL
jgi:hypothetical protein